VVYIVTVSASLKEDAADRVIVKVDVAEIIHTCSACNQCGHSTGVVGRIAIRVAS